MIFRKTSNGDIQCCTCGEVAPSDAILYSVNHTCPPPKPTPNIRLMPGGRTQCTRCGQQVSYPAVVEGWHECQPPERLGPVFRIGSDGKAKCMSCGKTLETVAERAEHSCELSKKTKVTITFDNSRPFTLPSWNNAAPVRVELLPEARTCPECGGETNPRFAENHEAYHQRERAYLMERIAVVLRANLGAWQVWEWSRR